MRKRRLAREAVGGAGLQAICLSKGGLGLGECLVWVEAKNWAENLLGKRSSSLLLFSGHWSLMWGGEISLPINCISNSRGSGLLKEG